MMNTDEGMKKGEEKATVNLNAESSGAERTARIAEVERKSVVQTYTRQPILLVRGSGARVWDASGREYIDFVAGVAVNNVGQCHASVVEAIRLEAKVLPTLRNIY